MKWEQKILLVIILVLTSGIVEAIPCDFYVNFTQTDWVSGTKLNMTLFDGTQAQGLINSSGGQNAIILQTDAKKVLQINKTTVNGIYIYKGIRNTSKNTYYTWVIWYNISNNLTAYSNTFFITKQAGSPAAFNLISKSGQYYYYRSAWTAVSPATYIYLNNPQKFGMEINLTKGGAKNYTMKEYVNDTIKTTSIPQRTGQNADSSGFMQWYTQLKIQKIWIEKIVAYNGTYGNGTCIPLTAMNQSISLVPVFVNLQTAGDLSQLPFGNRIGNLTANRMYRNGSFQKNNWIFINFSLTNTSNVSTVWVRWHNASQSANYTASAGTGGYYSVNITGQKKSIYTFEIFANTTDKLKHNLYNWTFYNYQSNWGNKLNYRKFVGIGFPTQAFSYLEYYLYNFTYNAATYQTRALPNEQPTDYGAPLYRDIGLFTSAKSNLDVELQCNSFVALFPNNGISMNKTELQNIYLHTWWGSKNNQVSISGCLQYNTSSFDISTRYCFSQTTYTSGTSVMNISKPFSSARQDIYHLQAVSLNTVKKNLSSNEINILSVMFYRSLQNVSVISTKNYTSFVIFNLPNRSILNSLDSDSDGLNDTKELFYTFTNPKSDDTDSDGSTDYGEYVWGSNPNDPNSRYSATNCSYHTNTALVSTTMNCTKLDINSCTLTLVGTSIKYQNVVITNGKLVMMSNSKLEKI